MTFTIGKRFSFAAAHHLEGLPGGHKCARVHGHSYSVEIVLANGQLDGAGFVADYGDLDPLRRYIDSELDHRDLNSVLPVQPSCENIARYLYLWCLDNLEHGHLVTAVRVSESPATWAQYAPDCPPAAGPRVP
jgi:6-pyruvoyltetrahydropterin/6-carboxytetrahydropterin synthase